jgi:hypothetical protein
MEQQVRKHVASAIIHLRISVMAADFNTAACSGADCCNQAIALKTLLPGLMEQNGDFTPTTMAHNW